MRKLCAALLLLLAPVAALADAVSEGPDKVALTLYHADGVSTSDLVRPGGEMDWIRQLGLALVVETRTVDLPAGPSIIRFRNVASTMVPQTADVQGFPQPVDERDFDYELLTPGSLLKNAIGQTVHLVRTNRKTGVQTQQDAVVRSAPSGVMLEIDGKLEAFQCSGLPERLEFDAIPEGLTDTPTLSLQTAVPAAGRYTVTLSYLATGLNWNADYVGRIAPDGTTLDLSGWLTLANFAATSFQNAPLDVVAGKLNTTGEDEPISVYGADFSSTCWPTNFNWYTPGSPLYRRLHQKAPVFTSNSPIASNAVETVVVTGSRVADPRLLGDLKLYSLPEPTTMAAQQTKQVQFLDRQAVPFSKLYTYSLDAEFEEGEDTTSDAATAMFRIANDKDGKLGKPLPAGNVSIEVADENGAPIFIGQNGIRDTPVGLPLEIQTGNALNVQVEHRVVRSSKDGDKLTRKTVDIVIANRNAAPVQFEFSEPLSYAGARIVSETADHTLKNNAAMWPFSLKAGERVSLEYTIEYSDE